MKTFRVRLSFIHFKLCADQQMYADAKQIEILKIEIDREIWRFLLYLQQLLFTVNRRGQF
jgi:hypothetical protein